MAENTNKLILLVVAAVALLLTLNIYQKQIGKNLAVVLAIVTIVVVGYVGFSLMNNDVASVNNANNVNLVNNGANNAANNVNHVNNVNNANNSNNALNNLLNNSTRNNAANNVVANNAANNVVGNNVANNVVASNNNGELNEFADANVEHFDGHPGADNERPRRRPRLRRGRGVRENFQGNANNDDNGNNGVNEVTVNSLNNDEQNSPASAGTLNCSDLLPADTNSTWAQVSPSGVGELCTKNLLNAGHHVGVNTQGCSLRNANRGLRSEPPNPQTQVSPWLQTTICPDLLRRPLE